MHFLLESLLPDKVFQNLCIISHQYYHLHEDFNFNYCFFILKMDNLEILGNMTYVAFILDNINIFKDLKCLLLL